MNNMEGSNDSLSVVRKRCALLCRQFLQWALHTALISPWFLFFVYPLLFHRLKGLIRDFYNTAANQQTCLLLLPLTWMQRQPSPPFRRVPGEHIKHMPSAPEAMKNKPTNKWISNHKGKKNKESLNYVGRKKNRFIWTLHVFVSLLW